MESVKPCTPSVRATGYKPTDAGGVHRRNESKTALDGGKRESKPVRVFLQGKAIYTTFVHGFAGIAKDPPQSTSLFIPTNVGIHGGDGGIRTHVPFRTTRFRVFYSQHTLADFEKKSPILREKALVRKKMIFSPLRLFPTVRNARELSERTNRTAIKHNNRKSP